MSSVHLTSVRPVAPNRSASPAARSAAGADQKTAPAEHERGFWGGVADVFIGGGQAIRDTVVGLGTAVVHPIDTAQGIGRAIAHPSTFIDAVSGPYKKAMAEHRPGLAIGRGLVAIGSIILPGGGIASAVSGIKSDASDTANAGSAAALSSDHSSPMELAPHHIKGGFHQEMVKRPSQGGKWYAQPSVEVQYGDSLSRIAARELGDARRWTEIYQINRSQIGSDPNRIRPGTRLTLPPR